MKEVELKKYEIDYRGMSIVVNQNSTNWLKSNMF